MTNPIIPLPRQRKAGIGWEAGSGAGPGSGSEVAHSKCNTLLPRHRSAGNLNFKRNMNNISVLFWKWTLCPPSWIQYVLIFQALEAGGSRRRPLTPKPNKEITCFLIPLLIFIGADTKKSFILKIIDKVWKCVFFNAGGFLWRFDSMIRMWVWSAGQKETDITPISRQNRDSWLIHEKLTGIL